MTRQPKLKICMLVVDANEVRGTHPESETHISPLLHPAMHNLLDGLKQHQDLEIEVVYGRKNPSKREQRREGSLRYVPVKYRELPIPGFGRAYAGRTMALLNYIRESNPDIVHAQGTERESGLVAALCRRPSLLTLHGNFREIARSLKAKPFSYMWVNARIEKWILPRVSGILCISNYTRRLIQELNSRSWVLPNAVDRQMLNVTNTPVPGRVVCIAAIDPRKNQISFMRAADSIAARNPDFHLHFWGPMFAGTDYAREFLSEVALRSWVTYHGASEIDGIGHILSAADVLVLPSIEDNCPVVILEAMAVGVPVVASDVGGIPDLVTHGKTGFMAPPEDQAGLAAAVQRTIEDPGLRANLATNARQEASIRFTPENIAQSHSEIYRELVECG